MPSCIKTNNSKFRVGEKMKKEYDYLDFVLPLFVSIIVNKRKYLYRKYRMACNTKGVEKNETNKKM